MQKKTKTKTKKVINKGNYQCYAQKFTDSWGQQLASSNKNIEFSSISNTKIIWKSTKTLHNWFPLKMQCFNI